MADGTAIAWLRIARDNWRFARRYSGNQLFIYIGLLLLAGYLEGFGIAMFLPILSDDIATRTDPASRAVVGILEFVGAPPTVAGALPLLAILFVAKGIFVYIAGLVQYRLSARMTAKVRREMTSALAVADYRFILQQTTASIQNLISSEVGRATSAFVSLSRLVPSIVNAALFSVILLLLDWKLTIAVALAGGVVLLILRLPTRLTRQMSKRQSEGSIRLGSLLIQSVQSFKYLAATGRFTRFRDHTHEAIDDLAVANERIGALYALTVALSQPVMVMFLAGMIYWQVVIGGNSLAGLLLMLMYMYRILLELFAAQAQWQDVAAVSAGVIATQEGIVSLAENREPTGARDIKALTKGIELRGVTFAYGDAPVLRDIQMTIPSRSMVALVGESGGGKSTLVDLLSGLLRPQQGQVLVDGVPLPDLDVAAWRRLIGFVPQDCVVFDDTIANNISLWDSSDRTRIEQAAKRAHTDEFVRAMPHGYETRIGERGTRLSGGQRQRLAIARELFKQPELLILDEATSALDSESERLVQQSIEELKGSATIVVIAHRLSTIRHSDAIHVLSKGEVVESGSFDELYARTDSRFRKMCDLQALR
jgi:subfamily B ATP-binding cassette protein MsbA